MTPSASSALRHTVALVDASESDRTVARALLIGPFDVMEYPDAPAALAGFRVVRPDVVLLDADLPPIEGMPVIARLRAQPALHSVPVIALLPPAAAPRGASHLEIGFDAFVLKAESASGLVETIRRLLASPDRRRAELRPIYG